MLSRSRRPMRLRALLKPLAAAGALAVSAVGSGCAARPGPSGATPAEPSRSACLVGTGGAAPAGTITAAFEDTAAARRSLLASSREPPIRLDCTGHPLPGLAVRWSRDSSARFWTLELGGAPAGDSAARWTSASLAAAWRADSAAGAALRYGGVTAVLPLDERRLVAELTVGAAEVPPVFGDRALGVPRTPRAELRIAAPASGDLRDAIDQGVDLVVATDPELLDYAGRRAGATTVALPWDRTYLLVSPSGSAGFAAVIPGDTAALRAALAGETVRVDARPAEPPFWWEVQARCSVRPGPRRSQPSADVVAYPAGDAVARDLAERFVALALPASSAPTASPSAQVTARGFLPDSFAAALRAGSERAYVVPVPRTPSVPCRELAGWPLNPSVVALVETRAHAVTRRGAPALVVEWDGAVRPAEAGDTLSP